jgi:hypothetical protein
MSNARALVHLLARVRLGEDEQALARALAPSVSWMEVAGAARVAAVAGLLYRTLTSYLSDLRIPSPALALLEASYRATLAGNLRRLRAADEVLDLLLQEGIEPILLKGALLVETLYLDPGVRPMRDVDLLVRPAEFPVAARILRRLGYECPTTPGREASEPRYFQTAFQREPDKVELHRALCEPDRYPAQVEALWSRSTPLQWRGRRVLALAEPDHLAYLALHAALHGFLLPLTCLVDVATILRGHPALAEGAAKRAREWRAGTAVHRALVLARDLVGAPLDPGVETSLRPGGMRRAYLRLCLHDDRMPAFRWGGSLRASQAATLLALMDGGRARYLGKYLVLRLRDLVGRGPAPGS